MGYNATTLVQQFFWSTTDATSGNNKGAIWQCGGGPSVDDTGNIYLETANGTFDANVTGGINYSDSAMKLSSGGTVHDYFTPSNQSILALMMWTWDHLRRWFYPIPWAPGPTPICCWRPASPAIFSCSIGTI